jgi:hypothetical protein
MRGVTFSAFCLLVVTLAGCGGQGSGGTPRGTPPQASIIVQGSQSPTVLLGQTAQFTAVVQNISNTSVTWQVNSVTGGNATVGTISNTGLYTAPTVIPSPNQIQITAVSVVSPSASGSTSFALSSNIIVTVSPQTASVIAGQTQQFSVTVQNAFNVGVTWQVNGFTGGPSCDKGFGTNGCISGTGLFTAPQSAQTVTITAVSVADPSKFGSATVAVTPHVRVSINPQSAVVFAGNTVQLDATVQNTSNTSVNWAMSPFGAQIGSISSSGLYTAPTSVSNLSIVIIVATSVVDSTIVAQAAIAVNSPSSHDAATQGRYAFSLLFGNFGSDGNSVEAGSIVADGSGNITTGVADRIRPSSHSDSFPVIGAYMIGSDNQGQLALLPTLPSGGTIDLSQILVFQFALGSFNQGIAGRAFIGSWGNLGTYTAAGAMLSQDSSAFSASTIRGNFAFGGPVAGSEVLAGAFQADGGGNLTSGSIDINNPPGVHGSDLALSDAPFAGTYSVDSSDGRGTATLNIPTIGTVNVVFYIVSAQKLFWLGSTPNGGAFCGSALPQSGVPFSAASLRGTSVFALTASAGVMSADGNGNVTGTVDGSEDASGNTVTNQAFTGTYTVSANGRGTLSIFNQNFVVWLLNQNSAFIIEAPNSSVVQAGFMEPQTAGPFTLSSIFGAFVSGGNSSPLDETIGDNANGLFGTFSSDGAGNLTGKLVPVEEPPINLCEGNIANTACSFAATYSVSVNGRGTMNATISPVGSTSSPTASSVFYMVAPNAFVTSGSLGLSFFGP